MTPEIERAAQAAVAAVSLWLLYRDAASELDARRAIDALLLAKARGRYGRTDDDEAAPR